MRPGVLVLSAALLLAAVAGQNRVLKSTRAESTPPAITACALEGAAVQGTGCTQPPLDSIPGTIVSYDVFPNACAGPARDLHVLRYTPGAAGEAVPLVATWCS
jgi:hypothetical protein